MTTVLLATDAPEVWDEVDAALASDECSVLRVRRGADVVEAIRNVTPDIVVLDQQIGTMGAMAAAMEVRLEESGDRLRPQKILLLLDRADDVFLARRCEADGWLVKPLDNRRLAAAVAAVLDGDTVEEGPRIEDALGGPR